MHLVRSRLFIPYSPVLSINSTYLNSLAQGFIQDVSFDSLFWYPYITVVAFYVLMPFSHVLLCNVVRKLKLKKRVNEIKITTSARKKKITITGLAKIVGHYFADFGLSHGAVEHNPRNKQGTTPLPKESAAHISCETIGCSSVTMSTNAKTISEEGQGGEQKKKTG